MGVIRLLAISLHGGLTDSSISFGTSGQDRMTVSSRDVEGLRQIMRRGVQIALVGGRRSHAVETFAEWIGVERLHQDQSDHAEALVQMQKDMGIDASSTAVVCADVPDLGMIAHAALSFAPLDAEHEAREAVSLVISRPAGHGALRDVCRFVMQHNADQG